MSIYKNGKKVSAIYRGSTPIYKVYKGETLVFDSARKFEFNLLYSLPWYKMSDAVRETIPCVDIVSNESVSANVYSYTTASRCDNEYCLSNTTFDNQCYAQFPLINNFDLTNARSIVLSYYYENADEGFIKEAENATLFNFFDNEEHNFMLTFLYNGGEEYARLYKASGSYSDVSDSFTLEKFNKGGYLVINLNGDIKTVTLYDDNASELATVDYSSFNNSFGVSVGKNYMAAFCPKMGAVHIRHMSVLDTPITKGSQLKDVDDYVEALNISQNSFKGKFATSGDKTIQVNDSDYTIHTDDNGNFDQEYSGDDITSLQRCFGSTDLEELDSLPSTSGVTNMLYMFQSCQKLTSLDLKNFDTSNVTNMGSMFAICYALASLDVSNFNTSNVTNMNSMFTYCTSLTSLDLSNWNTSKVNSMPYMFQNCTSLTSLDLKNFDTYNVSSMVYMFNNCSSLTSLDVSNFNTSNVNRMNNMFDGCVLLTSLDLSNWNTSKVTNMNNMFQNCNSLTSLDLSNWNTSKVTGMTSMFYACSTLKTLDVSNFDTSNVTTMSYMFANCSSLQAIVGIEDLNVSKVTTMYQTFTNCSSLESLDLSKWDVSNVTDMYSLFRSCNALKTLDVSTWDVSKVTDMTYMFGFIPFESLDLSNWNISNDATITNIFYNCNNLSSITCTQATKDKLMTLDTNSFPTRDTVQWTIVG